MIGKVAVTSYPNDPLIVRTLWANKGPGREWKIEKWDNKSVRLYLSRQEEPNKRYSIERRMAICDLLGANSPVDILLYDVETAIEQLDAHFPDEDY